jgi:hypothetical protein
VVLLETELGTEVIVGTQLQTFRNAGYAQPGGGTGDGI